MPTVLKSGSLNLPEPSGPLQACNEIALPLQNNVCAMCSANARVISLGVAYVLNKSIFSMSTQGNQPLVRNLWILTDMNWNNLKFISMFLTSVAAVHFCVNENQTGKI